MSDEPRQTTPRPILSSISSQLFVANIANEHRVEDQPQGESCIVAEDLPVVWRIAIDEFDREAELVCIEITGTLDVRNGELCRD